MSVETYSREELDSYKKVQALAYEAVEAVRKELYPGITEKQAAKKIDEYILGAGGSSFFHYGFAWFGDRTAFHGFKRPLSLNYLRKGEGILPHFGGKFQPSNRRLEEGMAVILDVAPTFAGRAADVGYAFSYGENSEHDKALLHLEEYRELILRRVLEERTLSEIYLEVDARIRASGYVNCHAIYPQGVLGHKVGRLPAYNFPGGRINGFPFQTFAYLLPQMIRDMVPGVSGHSPFWSEASDFRAEPGLWAVEPHIGKIYSGPNEFKSFGAKWEEILVVTESTAYWLDEDLPHVNLWKEKSKEKKKPKKANSRSSKIKVPA
ncbi:aminopeptidase P family protein [Leptospira langatensis]|uniref:Aminopeptidase P family protein n=1 Tax=Leptospira langatensis TaxID=2484983 RepID=A0A5F1ZS77_9LEPT|nr:M24 family metallopeptidase [Leptospira langatensis]TGJ98795.1 aminopeptidase P family protein [Leptospira langatensis]TGL40638.1 aminopeptidase P family protein [Leptospira langatensis]